MPSPMKKYRTGSALVLRPLDGGVRKWDIAVGLIMDDRINFFAAGFFDTIHTWLQKKNRTSEQIAKFLLEMLVQLRS